MASSPAEDEFLEYFSPSGSVVCRVLYQLGPMVYVQFRCQDWAGFVYRDFGNYARVALFHAHLRPADPQSPGVRNFVQALKRETVAQQQHVSNCRGQSNGKEGVTHDVAHPEKPTITEKVTAAQGNGVKPHPEPAPVRGRRARAKAQDVRPLMPVRSIAGLTLADFLCDR